MSRKNHIILDVVSEKPREPSPPPPPPQVPDMTDNESVFSDAADSVVDSVVSQSTVNSIPPSVPKSTTTTTPARTRAESPKKDHPSNSDDSHDQIDHAKGTNICMICVRDLFQ